MLLQEEKLFYSDESQVISPDDILDYHEVRSLSEFTFYILDDQNLFST